MDGNPITSPLYVMTVCKIIARMIFTYSIFRVRAPRLQTICKVRIREVTHLITGNLLRAYTECGENGAFIGRVRLERQTELYLKLV